MPMVQNLNNKSQFHNKMLSQQKKKTKQKRDVQVSLERVEEEPSDRPGPVALAPELLHAIKTPGQREREAIELEEREQLIAEHEERRRKGAKFTRALQLGFLSFVGLLIGYAGARFFYRRSSLAVLKDAIQQ